MAETYKNASAKGNFPHLRLLETFSGDKSDIYQDHIHCTPGPNSPGYRTIAEKIGVFLEKTKSLLNR
jgi:hypothetical protein